MPGDHPGAAHRQGQTQKQPHHEQWSRELLHAVLDGLSGVSVRIHAACGTTLGHRLFKNRLRMSIRFPEDGVLSGFLCNRSASWRICRTARCRTCCLGRIDGERSQARQEGNGRSDSEHSSEKPSEGTGKKTLNRPGIDAFWNYWGDSLM